MIAYNRWLGLFIPSKEEKIERCWLAWHSVIEADGPISSLRHVSMGQKVVRTSEARKGEGGGRLARHRTIKKMSAPHRLDI